MARDTVDSYIKNYPIETLEFIDLTPGERAAKFLNDLAEKYPRHWVSKRVLVKVATIAKNTPTEATVDKMGGKLSYILMRTDKILEEKYNRRKISRPLEGHRASVDDADLMENKLMPQCRRMQQAHAAVDKTSKMIDIKNLSGEQKNRLLKCRLSFEGVSTSLQRLPQLPEKTSV